MSRNIKRPRPEAIDEDFIALVLLVGPLAWALRWAWRLLRAIAREDR